MSNEKIKELNKRVDASYKDIICNTCPYRQQENNLDEEIIKKELWEMQLRQGSVEETEKLLEALKERDRKQAEFQGINK